MTIGLLVGLSASPVAGTFLTGLFGLLGGYVLAPFLSSTKPQAGEKDQGNNHGFELVTADDKIRFMRFVMIFCATCLFGMFAGSEVRTGNLRSVWQRQEKLVDISPGVSEFKDVKLVSMLYLLNVQKKLANAGLSSKANNAYVLETKNLLATTKVQFTGGIIQGTGGKLDGIIANTANNEIDDRMMILFLLNQLNGDR